MGLLVRDTQLHNYGECLTWPEGTRYELIDSVVYAMAPAPTRVHHGWWSNYHARLGML
jgi:hypothetical protein